MKRIKRFGVLALIMCLLATMLPSMTFVAAESDENDEAVLTGIEIISQPVKTEYWTGEALDTTGLTLVALYSDGSMVEISEGFTVSGFDSTVAGEQILTVQYMDAAAGFAVTVKAPEMTGIQIVNFPVKTEYWVGEILDTTGLTLVALYSDGSMVEISEGFTVSGFNSAVAGEQTLTVTYMDATATITVTVKQSEAIGIEVISQPAKTVYWTGEELDTTGLELLATYSDGTTAQITEGFTVSGFDSTLAGQQTLTVMYGEATAEFTVFVEELYLDGIEINTLPAKTEYWVGEALDTTGLILNVFYSDDSVIEITEGFTVSGFSSTTAGKKTVFVYYQDQKTFFTVTVKTPELTGITVNTLPDKTEYLVGEVLDTTGLTLTATYADGSTKTISSGFTAMNFNSSTAGTKKVIVLYKSKTTNFSVTVKNPCTHTDVEDGICTQCEEPIVATVTDSSGNLIGNYITLANARAAAEEGHTLSLQADVTETDEVQLSGMVLDLNGHTLTAGTVQTFTGSGIIDSSEDVSGLLKITEADGNLISPNNSYLPVYDSAAGGYRFFAVSVVSSAVTGNNKYWFRVEVANFEEFYPLIQSGAQVLIQVKMTWDGQTTDTYAAADLSFTKAWADRYHANEDIYITVSVVDAGGLENFKLIPMITSGGVEISGNEM